MTSERSTGVAQWLLMVLLTATLIHAGAAATSADSGRSSPEASPLVEMPPTPDVTVQIEDRVITVTGLFADGKKRAFRGPSLPILNALAQQSWQRLTEIVTGFSLSGDLWADYSTSKSNLVLSPEIRQQIFLDLARQGALIYDELFNRIPELAGEMQRFNQNKDSVKKLVYIYSDQVLLPWSVIYAADSRLLNRPSDVDVLKFWGYRYRLAAFIYSTAPQYWSRPLPGRAANVLFGHYDAQSGDELSPEVITHVKFFKDDPTHFTRTDDVATGDGFLERLKGAGAYHFVYVFAHGAGGLQAVQPSVVPPADQAPTASLSRPIDTRASPLEVGMWFSPTSFLTPRDIRNINLETVSADMLARGRAVKGAVILLNICEGGALGQSPDATFPSAFFDVGAGVVLTPSVKVWARFARDYFTEFAKHIGANGISDISGIVYEMNRDYLSRGLPFSLFYALYGNGPVSTAPPLTPAQRNATN